MGRDHKGQRGAILVLTAFLLPFIIAFTGMAVDLGNLYVQHQRLQNAADAAVLAGANNFQADNITAAKSNADKAAKENGDINCDGSMKNAQVTMETKINDPSKPSYYGVKMTKPVPIYFLSIFPEINNTYDVNAFATAKLNIIEKNSEKKEALLDSLMILNNSINIVGETGSNESNKKNNIRVTFDGKIVLTNPEAKTSDNSIVHKEKGKVFLTSKTQQEGLSVDESLATDESAGYWHYAKHEYDYRYYDDGSFKASNPLVDAFSRKTPKNVSAYDVRDNPSLIQNLKDNEYLHITSGDTLELNKLDEIGDNSNEPIYVMIDPFTNTKIQLKGDMQRPLIIYYNQYNLNGAPKWMRDGVQQGWLKSNVTVEAQGHKFRGIIYNPQGTFHTNTNGGTIRGSIVAADIDLQGAPGKYIYEAFTDSGSNGNGSGNGSIAPNGHIALVENDKIQWDDK